MIEIRDAYARPGTVCSRFSVSGMPSMSRLHVCVDLSLDLPEILIEIGLIAGCKLFTGVPGSKKCTVDPEYSIYSLFFIFMRYVEYAVSIVLGVCLFMIVVL